MTKELKVASGIEDPKSRALALGKFRNKYKVKYGQILTKAGVNVDDFIQKLQAKYPKYIVSANNDYSISFRNKPERKTAKPGNPQPVTRTEEITGFLQAESMECSTNQNGIEFGPRKLEVFASASLGGGCDVEAYLRKTVTRPITAQSISLKLDFELEAYASATGLIGPGMCWAWSYIKVVSEGQEVINDTRYASVFPLIGWFASEASNEEFSYFIDVTNMNSLHIEINGMVDPTSGFGETSGRAAATVTKAQLLVRN
jgi:hypothetical protein